MRDLTIIGAGPAGISAFIEAERLGLTAVVVEKGDAGGVLGCARRIENFPPFPAQTGRDLAARFRERFFGLRPEVVMDEAVSVETEKGECRLRVVMKGGNALLSRAVILAVGQSHYSPPELGTVKDVVTFPGERLPLPGDSVIVYGGGDAGFDQALLFADIGCEAKIFCRGRARAKPALASEARLRGVDVLEGFELASAKRDGPVVTATFRGGGGRIVVAQAGLLLAALGKRVPHLTLDGWTLEALLREGVSESGEMAVGRIFAAGDVRRGRYRNVAVAVGDGVMAANGAAALLKGG